MHSPLGVPLCPSCQILYSNCVCSATHDFFTDRLKQFSPLYQAISIKIAHIPKWCFGKQSKTTLFRSKVLGRPWCDWDTPYMFTPVSTPQNFNTSTLKRYHSKRKPDRRLPLNFCGVTEFLGAVWRVKGLIRIGLIRYETNPKNAGFTGKSLKVTVDGSEIR